MTILFSADFFPEGNVSIAIEPRVPQEAFPEHHHDFDEIVLVEQGSGIHVFNGQPSTLYAGCVYFVRSHDRHLYEHTNNLCLTNILYRDSRSFRFLNDLTDLLPAVGCHGCINQKEMREALLIAQQMTPSGVWTLEKQAHQEQNFMRLLLLLRGALQHFAPTHQNNRLNQLINWLHEHFSEEICWEALADNFSISLRTLHRQLKHQTGDTPQRYLNKLRLLQARFLLRHSELRITDIAYQCGFSDSNHFSTLFRKEFGYAPRVERQVMS